jgi:hypothetical protein
MQKGCEFVFCRRLPLSIEMRGPCIQVLNGWTKLGVDATCRHIQVPQAGFSTLTTTTATTEYTVHVHQDVPALEHLNRT